MKTENETIADIASEKRRCADKLEFIEEQSGRRNLFFRGLIDYLRNEADRIEAAAKRERELLRSCARWILTHDIYGHMAQELLAECKKVLGDDGNFLIPKGGVK